MNNIDRVLPSTAVSGSIGANVGLADGVHPVGTLHARLVGPVEERRAEYVARRDRIARMRRNALVALLLAPLIAIQERRLRAIPMETKWSDTIHNLMPTEGKNALLTHGYKGSAYTASLVLGLIEDTGYSAIAATNTAANITAVGGGSPANGWNEAPVGTCAARGTPAFGTAAAGALSTSSAVALSMLATDTIKGAFLLTRSTAGTAPTTTVGNTSGALISAGLFTGGDRAVLNGDTLNVSHTITLT